VLGEGETSRVSRMSVRRSAHFRAGAMIATTVLTALALGGCASDPAPSGPATSVSPSPSAATDTPAPTPPAAPTPPERPAAMDGTDDEAAKAAAGYFLELYSYVQQAKDLDSWAAVSGPACTICASVDSDIKNYLAEELTVVGGDITWTGEPAVTRRDGNEVVEVLFDTKQSESQTLDVDGEVLESFEDGAREISVFVYWDQDWRLFDMGQSE